MTVRPPIRLLTDFNSVTEEGWNASTVGVGGGTSVRPDEGEKITLFDGEGHSCKGVVERVRDVQGRVLVYTSADPDTWTEESVSLSSDLLEMVEAASRNRNRGPTELKHDRPDLPEWTEELVR
jgi:hypothetical protein